MKVKVKGVPNPAFSGRGFAARERGRNFGQKSFANQGLGRRRRAADAIVGCNMQNKQGLSRYIPSDIRRAVRQRSGFGCVLCGCAIGEYEHVVPEFKDATSHNLDGIAYLCPTCHAKVTKGLIDKKTVLEAMRNPWAIRHGHCHDAFVIGDDNASVRLGGMTFYNCIALSIDTVPIFGILPPVQKGQPYRLFGTFTDQTGQVTLKIEDNEWLGNAKIWDIEVIGRRVIVRERQGKIALLIEAEPPQGINVKRLDMYLNDIRLVGSQEFLWIKSRGWFRNLLTL